jgi:hypothetical protein
MSDPDPTGKKLAVAVPVALPLTAPPPEVGVQEIGTVSGPDPLRIDSWFVVQKSVVTASWAISARASRAINKGVSINAAPENRK